MASASLPLGRTYRDEQASPDALLSAFEILEPPVDIRRVVRALGVQVCEEQGNPGWDGAIQSSETAATIWLRASDGEARQRFTLAHELGHLMRHPLGTLFSDANLIRMHEMLRRGENLPAGYHRSWEREANQFAASLLMPRWMLDAHASRLQGDVARLAALFNVSHQALEIRLQELFVA